MGKDTEGTHLTTYLERLRYYLKTVLEERGELTSFGADLIDGMDLRDLEETAIYQEILQMPLPETPEQPSANHLPQNELGPTSHGKRSWQELPPRLPFTPRRTGKRCLQVYHQYRMAPAHVGPSVRAAMPKSVARAYQECYYEADLDGRFEMPAGRLVELIGVGRRHVQRVMTTMVEATLIEVLENGGPTEANLYRLVPAKVFDGNRALAAFKEYKDSASKRIESIKRASKGSPG